LKRQIATYEHDVLVLGSGGAGCRAAFEADLAGARVALVTKGLLGRSGTTAFKVADTAGYNAADGVVDPSDNPQRHFEDIMAAGLGMAYEDLAWILAAEAPATLSYLENLGVKMEKDPDTGQYIEVKGCFASRPRMHLLRGHGEPIIKAMVPMIRSTPVQVFERTIISRLLVRDGACIGAVGVNPQGEPVVFKAKSTILCCGGAGQLFTYTLTPQDITGDGYALGLRAGADLVNMEFMQVVLGTVAPTRNQLNTFLWCGKPQLLARDGKPLLEKYLPHGITMEGCMEDKATHFPFSTRDASKFIEIAVQKEMLSGAERDRESVLLDLTGITDEVVGALPKSSPLPKVWLVVKEFLRSRGFSIETKPFPIACFAHAVNGGVKIDNNAESTVRGLYAAGEAAGGPHGADRLGGNMLVTCQVFGARAGKAAARRAMKVDMPSLPNGEIAEEIRRLTRLRGRKGSLSPDQLKAGVQDAMWRGVLVVRNKRKLSATLERLEEIKDQATGVEISSHEALVDYLELETLLTVGKAVTCAALRREESRGSHYREDYPEMDPRWDRRILLRYEDGALIEHEEDIAQRGPAS
jgi:succinate dehydrogenase/fumarate reductase flavoprotein subunit